MKKIIFGTKNQAKIDQIQATLQPLGIRVKGIGEYANLPEVVEDGKTAQQNARKKAMTYAEALGKIVFSLDTALFIEGLPDNLQPGINVRRIPGSQNRPTDEQILKYYSNLIKTHGGEMFGYWDFAIAIAAPDSLITEAVVKTPRRRFVDKICSKVVTGFPMESIQIDAKSGKYIAEMSPKEQGQFWQDTIGVQAQAIFQKIL